jgi:hypothetical protein
MLWMIESSLPYITTNRLQAGLRVYMYSDGFSCEASCNEMHDYVTSCEALLHFSQSHTFKLQADYVSYSLCA